MKKLSAFIISAVTLFSLTACGSTSPDSGKSGIYSNGAGQSVVSTLSAPASETANTAQTSSNVPESSLTSSDEPTSSVPSTNNSSIEEKPIESTVSQSQNVPEQPTSATPSESEGAKILVAYFSATNTTKGVAQKIAGAVNADLYEIVPQQPYTSDDLNYHSDSSRTSIEMNDPNARPAISGSVADMDWYDIVFVGYPIWWGDAPRIMSTFVESYSFSDKTVVPFCTSGGSGVGSSAKNLERQAGGGNWLSGTRLNGSASDSDISGWINGLGLEL